MTPIHSGGARTPLTVLALCAALLGTACGGDPDQSNTPGSGTATPGAAPAPAGGDTGAGMASTGGAAGDTVITPELIAQGERVFKGQEGGAICVTCHGQDASGMAGLGPNLRDGQWLHGDGSLQFIQNIIRTGVSQPKESSSVMPPYGGVPFSDEHLRAVAAYIYSLNNPQAG